MQLVVETIFQERTSVTNGLKWLPHRQSDIANVQQTELIYARLLQSVVKLSSVIPAGRQCNWQSYIVCCFVVSGKFCFRTTISYTCWQAVQLAGRPKVAWWYCRAGKISGSCSSVFPTASVSRTDSFQWMQTA